MKTSDFDYYLPQELIAQKPIEPRDSSRLMVAKHTSGEIFDDNFKNLTSYLNENDTLVLNESRVIPARLYGTKEGSSTKAELLLLKRRENGTWEALAKPGKRLKEGIVVEIVPGGNATQSLQNKVYAKIEETLEEGLRLIRFSDEKKLYELGVMPLPPYIKEKLHQPERYQTIYSKGYGSVAAPTAGLHFTEEMFSSLREKGVNICFVSLHIGLDTFRPISVEDPRKHPIHSEYGEITETAAKCINTIKENGGRVIAVGTSSIRLLEHAAAQCGGANLKPYKGWVDTFILPGYKFKIADALLTNFHLPKSTLLMLVSSFAGKELIDKAYNCAIERKYRFYSFGDAMLIL